MPTSCRFARKGAKSAGDRRFPPHHHASILIYPNPLNPKRYVVLNSGFTFREHADMSNALQIPMLPDWAIVDIRTPPGEDWPGKMAAADFFDEDEAGPATRGISRARTSGPFTRAVRLHSVVDVDVRPVDLTAVAA